MKLIVTGAGGLLGGELVRVAGRLGHDVVALPRAALDVCDPEPVDALMSAERPDVVAHCAAYTAVDRAESEPAAVLRTNRDGARSVARAAEAVGARMVYFSTDYVFDGAGWRPYLPADPPAPLSVYGRSKLEGERAVSAVSPRSLIVRTGWLYGRGGGFVSAILRRAERGEALRVVDDQHGGPTWTRNLAERTIDLVGRGASGVWHVADRGEVSWFELAVEVLRRRGLDTRLSRVSSEEWGAAARRPAYSVLDVTATEEVLGRRMMEWQEALGKFFGDERFGTDPTDGQESEE